MLNEISVAMKTRNEHEYGHIYLQQILSIIEFVFGSQQEIKTLCIQFWALKYNFSQFKTQSEKYINPPHSRTGKQSLKS